MVKDFFDGNIKESIERLLFIFYTGSHQYYKRLHDLYSKEQRLKIERELLKFQHFCRDEKCTCFNIEEYSKEVLEIFNQYLKAKQEEFLSSPFTLSEKIQENALNKAKSVLPLIQIVEYHRQFSDKELKNCFL